LNVCQTLSSEFSDNTLSKISKNTKSFPVQKNQIIGRGFNHFVAANREALARGEEFHLKLALPAMLDRYAVVVRKSMIEGDIQHIRVEIDHWAVRDFNWTGG
jgi:hypothetical protein